MFDTKKTWTIPIILLIPTMLLAAAGFQPGFLDYKFISLVVFGSIGLTLIALPYRYSVFALFLYIGVEGAAKLLSRYHPLIHVGVDVLIIALATKAAWILMLNRYELPRRVPFIIRLMGVHFFWFVIVFLNPYALSAAASLAAAKLYVVPPLLFIFGYLLCNNRKNTEFYMMSWIIVMILQTVFSLYQGAIGPTSVTSWSPAYQTVLNRFIGYPFRPFGLTSQPGAPAVFSYLVAPLAVYFFLKSNNIFVKLVSILLILSVAVMLMLCQVKSAIIKFAGSILFTIFLSGFRVRDMSRALRIQIVAFIVVVVTICSIGIPLALSTLVDSNEGNREAIDRSMMAFDMHVMGESRKGAMERFLRFAEIAPLGAGLSRIGPAVYKFNQEITENEYFKEVVFFSDNFWVQVVVDLGLPGVILFTSVILICLFNAAKALMKVKSVEDYIICAAIFSSLGAIFSGSYGAEPILYNPEASFFWFFSGAAYHFANGDLKKFAEQSSDRAIISV